MSKVLNIKPQALSALGYILRVTWWHVVVAIVEASIHRGSKLDMAASVDRVSVTGCASSSTLLSPGAAVFVLLMKQTGQEAWVRVVRD